jgi:hypothetical protein
MVKLLRLQTQCQFLNSCAYNMLVSSLKTIDELDEVEEKERQEKESSKRVSHKVAITTSIELSNLFTLNPTLVLDQLF